MENFDVMESISESLEHTKQLNRAAVMAVDFFLQSGAAERDVEAVQHILNLQCDRIESIQKAINEKIYGLKEGGAR